MQQKELLPIGTILDSGERKYEIESVLGKGGFGITYLATSTIHVGNIPAVMQFAIKEHYISSMNERQGTSVSISNVNNTEEINESIDSFLVEAKRLNKLSLNHNGLVRVNESFRANGTAYYVMEYIKGQSLRDYVKHSPQGRIGEAEALQLFRPIAETIGYLHDNMVTHLDIKPDNILIRENGEPVIIDFGLSKHYSAKGTPTSTIKAAGCSAGYSPMEQYAGITTFSPEADVYALGATLFYMLTGKDPMISTEINESIIRRSIPTNISSQTIDAIVHAMEKLKDNRTDNVRDLINTINSGSPSRDKDSIAIVNEKSLGEEDATVDTSDISHMTKKMRKSSIIKQGLSKKMVVGALACSLLVLLAILHFAIPRNDFKVDVNPDTNRLSISYEDEKSFSGEFSYNLRSLDNPGEGISGVSKKAKCNFSVNSLMKGKYVLTINYKGIKEEIEVAVKDKKLAQRFSPVIYSQKYPNDILAQFVDTQNQKCPYRWNWWNDAGCIWMFVQSVEYDGAVIKFHIDTALNKECTYMETITKDDLKWCVADLRAVHNPLKAYLGVNIMDKIIKKDKGLNFIFYYNDIQTTFTMATTELKKYREQQVY